MLAVQRNPPSVEDIARSVRQLLRAGLPLGDEIADPVLLDLRGVVARSVDPDSRLDRVASLSTLLERLIVRYPDDVLGEAARTIFAVTPGTRGTTLTERRARAATEASYDHEHFRKKIEPKIVQRIAWLLHQDAQQYTPRDSGLRDSTPYEVSGDTPYISRDDLSSQDNAEREEAISELWGYVYFLRAAILRVERLKAITSADADEQRSLDEAISQRDALIQSLQILIRRYIDQYGETLMSGKAEFRAAQLLRLAGWRGAE